MNTQGQEPNNNTQPNNAEGNGVANQEPKSQEPQVKTFTQEEVDKLIAKRLDRVRRMYEEVIGKA